MAWSAAARAAAVLARKRGGAFSTLRNALQRDVKMYGSVKTRTESRSKLAKRLIKERGYSRGGVGTAAEKNVMSVQAAFRRYKPFTTTGPGPQPTYIIPGPKRKGRR